MTMDTLEAITINYEEEGILIIKELEKEIISKKAAWVTALFRYQEWNAKKEEYSADKFAIYRYQMRGGEYRTQAKFKLTDIDQAKALVKILGNWLK